RVAGDVVTLLQGLLRQDGPRQAGGGVCRGHRARVPVAERSGRGVLRQVGQRDAEQVGPRGAHRDFPAERRCSQAWATRAAIDASASLPQVRGSYIFLLPTSPSTFSTPS